MQETALGGLSKAILRKLQTSAPTDALPAKKRRPRPSFKPGKRLVKGDRFRLAHSKRRSRSTTVEPTTSEPPEM
jgi:hypothetical protein